MQHAHQLTQSKGKKKDCDRSHESEVYFFRVLLTLELIDIFCNSNYAAY